MYEPLDPAASLATAVAYLTDSHRCPGCFTPLKTMTCDACGLELADARAPRLLVLGRQITSLEEERQSVLTAMRADIAERAAISAAEAAAEASARAVEAAAVRLTAPVPVAAGAAAAVVSLPVAASTEASRVAPDVPAPPVSPTAPAVDAPSRQPRRRLSVPVLLTIVGVTLLAIAAVGFLVLAWFVASIEVRALIIAGITLATIVTASLLRRRDLVATSEGVAVLGTALLALDAWAVRANDLFGAGSADPAVYAGVAAISVAVVCRVWARLSQLHGPDIAAVLAWPAGLGFLIAGVVDLPPGEAILAGLVGAAAGGLVFALPAPFSAARAGERGMPERTALAFIGVVAGVAALVAAYASGASWITVVWSTSALAAIGIGYAWFARPRRGAAVGAPRVVPSLGAGVAAAAVALSGLLVSFDIPGEYTTLLLAPGMAVGAAVGADILRARTRSAAPTITAPVTAGVIALFTLLSVMISWLASGARGAYHWVAWQTDPFTAAPLTSGTAWVALLSAALVGVLLFAAPSLSRPGFRQARPSVAIGLILVAAMSSTIPAVVVGSAVLSVVAAIAGVALTRARLGWGIAGAGAALVGLTAGIANPWLWLIAAGVAIAYPIALDVLVRPTGVRAAWFTAAPVVVAAAVAFGVPWALAALTGASGETGPVALALLSWIALLTLTGALVLPLGDLRRTVLAGSALALVVIAVTGRSFATIVDAGTPITETPSALDGVIGEPLAGIVRGMLLAAALTAAALLRGRLDARIGLAAAALVAPVLTVAAADLVLLVSPASPTAALVHATPATLIVMAAATLYAFRPDRTGVRVSLEAGAAVALMSTVWGIPADLAWAMLALVAAAVAASTIAPGWIAPATTRDRDVFATSRAGVPLVSAPRRLLVWPALGLVIAAWWAWLSSATIVPAPITETYVVPAGIALVVLAVPLVHARRRMEATIAVAVGLTLGLVVPALTASAVDPVRGVWIAVAATVVCLALSAPPLRAVTIPAVTGATVALLSLALVAVPRAVDPPAAEASGMPLLWLTALVVVALLSSWGFAGDPLGQTAALYARAIPAVALGTAAIASVVVVDHAATVALVMAGLAVLHLLSAGIDRVPLATPVRWTALAGAVLLGAEASLDGTVTVIEAVSLPVAALCLAGAVLAAVRRAVARQPWPGPEAVTWAIGLGLATLPSLIPAPTPLRAWLVVGISLVVALGAAASPVPDSWRVRTQSSVLLGAVVLAMGLRVLSDPGFPAALAAVAVAGAGALAVAALVTRTAIIPFDRWGAAILAGAAFAVMAIGVLATPDAAVWSLAAVVVAGAGLAAVGALALGRERWRLLGGVAAVGGLVVAVTAAGARLIEVYDAATLEADAWIVGVALAAVAVGVLALRSAPTPGAGRVVGAGFAAAALLFGVAQILLVPLPGALGDLRAAVAMTVLSAAAVMALIWRERIGLAASLTAAAVAAVYAVTALIRADVPAEVLFVPPAVAGILYGVWWMRRDDGVRSWVALGPWLALLTVPSLVYDFVGETELWRIVALGVAAIAMVVVGAARRLQAPLIIGSVVLLVHAGAQLWPWISAAYAKVPWWLWLGIGGVLLIFMAARYEKNLRAARTAYMAVTSLR